MDKLLLLEDDYGLIDGLKYSLEKNGFDLTVVTSVKEAKEYIRNNHDRDLLILDVSLPDGTGFQVCEYVRELGSQVPIIFLTAADEEFNIIRGLDSGGDDYLTKPFKLGELCSRINALLRRSRIEHQDAHSQNTQSHEMQNAQSHEMQDGIPHMQDLQLKSGDVVVDLPGCRAYYKEQPLDITAAEYRLLCIMIRNRNRVVTRQIIFDSMWDGKGNFVNDNTLSVYIRRLREKIEDDPSHPKYLKTARGFGYIWEDNANESV